MGANVQKPIAPVACIDHRAPMAYPVYIHAGAHRTGTSSFQMCLSQNRTVLETAGFDLAYPGRDGIPQGRLRLQLPRPRHGRQRVPQFAASAGEHLGGFRSENGQGLILSEENIPGMMRQFYDGRFYPAAENRCAALAGALPSPPEHVVLVVRDYARIYASAYRKRAEDNPVPDFSDLVPNFLAMDRGWPELVHAIKAHLQPRKLTVLTYERRGESRDLLRRLVPGLVDAALVEPERTVNLSATDAALNALQAIYRTGTELKRRQWQQVIADHSGQSDPTGFATFPAEAQAQLDGRYRRDLDALTEMEGIAFVG